jgi:hypothetical protein
VRPWIPCLSFKTLLASPTSSSNQDLSDGLQKQANALATGKRTVDEVIVLRASFPNSFQRRADKDSDVDSLTANDATFAVSPLNFFSGDLLADLSPTSPGGAVDLSPTSLGGAIGFKPSASLADVAPTSLTVETAPLTVAEGTSVEIPGVSAESVTFTGTTGTLTLDHSLAFTGVVAGLAGSDAVDLADVSYGIQTQVTYLGNTTGGTLTITDGIHTANIALQGNYLSSTWTVSSDGFGGTLVVDPVANSNWKPLALGGGGFVTGLDVAPDGTMVSRTDTYGAYIWNGTQWQQLVTSTSMPSSFVIPNSGQGVYEIQIAPSNTNILYMMFDGDVFVSTNKGASWTQTSFSQVTADPNDPFRMNGQKMAVDPNNPNVVYVGTPQNGLFVTTNGGVTWQNVSAVPVSQSASGIYPGITGIMFDPALGKNAQGNTNVIFGSSWGNGVYESTNGGASWSNIGGPRYIEYAAVSSTGAYYVISDNGSEETGTGLWRYLNGTWTELSNADPSMVNLHTVAVNPLNPNEIAVQGAGGNLDVSFDGGVTWSGMNWSYTENGGSIPWLADKGVYDVGGGGFAFNPLVPGQVISTGGVGVWNFNIPSNFTSSNAGSFNNQTQGIEQLVVNEIIVPPGGDPIVASWDRAFFQISNESTYPSSYGPVNAAFAAGWSIDYASSNPSFLVGIADWWGNEESGYSTDGGKTWTKFASEAPTANGQIGGSIAASSPTDIVWAPANGAAPYYTTNGGATWNPVVLPGVTDWSDFDFAYYLDRRTVTADRVLSNTFYMYYIDGAGDNLQGIYKSTNGGQSWTQVHSGALLPFGNGFNAQLESVPGEAGNLFFTGGNTDGSTETSEPFMRSTNGGATWTAIANVDDVICFGFGAAAPGQSYPAVYIVGWVNHVYGIWQSNDNAQSWTQIGTYPTSSLDEINTITGDPNNYGQVYVGFAGGGAAYLSAAATVPSVTAISDTPSTGDLNAGKTVTLTLNLSSAVTVAGGTPTLTLNDGGTATYTGGSGTNALAFSYTVGAGDSNVASLSATAVNLNGSTINDGSGNAASLSLSGLTQTGPQIDTNTVITAIAETPSSGILNAGKTVTYTLTMNEVVTINTTGGSPTLALNDAGTATYVGGSGTNALTFSYTVLAGQNTPDLMVSGVSLNGATMMDGAGNSANLSLSGLSQGSPQVDTTPPTVSSVTATAGSYNTGKVLTLTLNTSGAVTVTGTPTLTLNDGGTATYTGGSGGSALTFSYTVGSGQNTAGLAATAVNGTIADLAGNALSSANLPETFTGVVIDTTTPSVSSVVASGTGITAGAGVLTVGGVVTLTVNLNEAVTVAGGTPTLTLNDGGTASYTGGSGSSALTFSYTVAAGQNTTDLAVNAFNINSATVKNAAGTAANLTGAVANPAGILQISTTGPAVSSVVASGSGITAGSGDLSAGGVVTLTVNLSSAVTVAGGTPTLTLNDGGTATYTGGSGTSALTFSYTVGAGQNTADLAVTAVSLNSATVTDGAGNVANLTGAVTNPAGTLQIDTTTPSVSSVAASGSGITAGAGDLAAGSGVTLTVNLSEAVTVAGGTPTLTLNDGGIATYSGGSGTSALIFSYTVGAGQSTADLAVTSFNPGTATIKNGAGTAANLAGAVTNPSGTLQIDTTTPSVSSVVASGTGITAGAGDLKSGSVLTLTVSLSEAVTVVGGTPTLTLNDGGTATYTGGSGTSALTFSYTVGAGQNSADLAVTAFNPGTATIKNGAGTAANLSGAVTSLSGTLQIDTTAPTVASLVASGSGITAGSGDLPMGSVVTLTVNLSEAVTVAGGTPTLTLNDGGSATYTGGSGTNALAFTYAVGAGQSTADLAVTAVNLGTATVKDGAGNAANLAGAVTNPAGTLQIDTATPSVSSVVASGSGITAGAGDLAVGSVVTLTVNLSSAVTVAGGTPTLTLNDGGTASYSGGSGSNALTFSYTVAAGQNTADLAVTAFNPNSATITNGAGTAANLTGAVTGLAGTLQIDTLTPSVSSVVATGSGITAGTGDLNAGYVVTLTVNLNDAVTVTGGTPTLTLNDGGTATYSGGSGSNALIFSYTVAAGQNTADLAVTAFNPGTATIKNGAGTAADLTGAVTGLTGTLQIDTTIPTVTQVVASPGTGTENPGDVITLTVDLNKAVTVTGTPTLTLNDGGTATYTGGSGSSALTFSYTVTATDTTVPTLAINQVNLPGGATVKDAAGNTANLSGAVTTFPGLSIDPPPIVVSISETPSTGDLNAGHSVTLTLKLNDVVTVAGGVPTLTLNDGGTATYISGSGSNALTFSYTVGAGQNVASLAATAVNLNGATVQNGMGDAAVLLVNGVTQTGPQIDTTAPTVTSVAASGTGITAGSGDIPAGSVVTLTVNLSEVVTVTGGTPTLTLNDGGTATYMGGTGSSNALIFSYTVAIGQNTADLAVTALNLNSATVKDGAGNVANLAGAVTTPAGTLQIDTTTHIAHVGSNYFLDNVNGSGPELKFGGVPVVPNAGQFIGWTGIGAVQVAGGGYDVAWKDAATNQYAVWTTDSSGNFVSSTGAIAANSSTLETYETTFNQDLNGDGVMGIPTTVIQTNGSTSLVQVGSNYFLDPVGTSSGPELKFGGVAVVPDAGQFSGWAAIGAEQTSSGYDVAWKDAATNQYAVWATDSSGNFVSSTGAIAATSSTLETYENIFQQDLNGDGVVGIYAAPGTTLQISNSLSGPSGSATIGTGATLELAAADTASVTFSSFTGMLRLGSPSTFDGVIFGFTGNGSLSSSDQIDLKGINFNSVQDSLTNGVLTVSDGTHSAALDFNGSYTLANFKFASDGNGGTIVYDPPVPAVQGGNVPAEIMNDPGIMNDPVVSALNQQMALLSQHIASAFPSSGFGDGSPSTVTQSQFAGSQLTQLAVPVANQQHA